MLFDVYLIIYLLSCPLGSAGGNHSIVILSEVSEVT